MSILLLFGLAFVENPRQPKQDMNIAVDRANDAFRRRVTHAAWRIQTLIRGGDAKSVGQRFFFLYGRS
jgi:hypothetical protein